MIKTRTEKVIDVDDWDSLVKETYGRTYDFQQQDGCRDRGIFVLTVPAPADDYKREKVPEVVNHDDMGVSFAAWLARDPKAPLPNQGFDYELALWWERNFYPDIQMVANDLNARGLIEDGEFLINIDW